jgi:wyosine [tRNA(Phe)-imidazoG37] synthetase (radical SAM superfamily)
MIPGNYRYVYGPVPSRRLGRSLGVDIVPLKVCTYDCVYCQLGRTTRRTVERSQYIPVGDVVAELSEKLAEGDAPDYISLAGSGEPTLNSGIGELILRIKALTEIPVVVLTNGSLLWMEEVQEALMEADLVLPSLDAGDEQMFRVVNHPHEKITFKRMVEGIIEFTERFPREIWLEVLLLADVTGVPSEAGKIGAHAKRIGPARIQLGTVTRPPAQGIACPVTPYRMRELRRYFPGIVDIISESVPHMRDVPIWSERRAPGIVDLLSRRPCTAQDIAAGLGIHVAEALKHLEALNSRGIIVTRLKDGQCFYLLSDQGSAARPS